MVQQVDDNNKTIDMLGFGSVCADDIDRMVDEDELHRWPETVREMYELFKDQTKDSAQALSLLVSVCQTFGGLQIYLPRGRQLDAMVKSLNIWREFKGDNVPSLARKYGVSEQHIYRTIAKMRKREIRKLQPELF
ncbi:Mor transcription activator family protein [Photobacterium damselae]|uniref:Mor transcription activator family protein n=1 Tax=Photobacterium damselae TaxID=38293 RepID=UPI0035A8CEE5